MNTPTIRAVRLAHPNAHISVLARKWVADVFEHNPNVNSIIRIPPEQEKGVKAPFELGKHLRRQGFSKAYILPNSFSSAFSVFWARVPNRIGYATQGRSVLLTTQLSISEELLSCHQVYYYLALVPEISLSPEQAHPSLYIRESESNNAKQRLDRLGIDSDATLLGVAPGAVFGPAKRWPADRFAETISRLNSSSNCYFLLFGSMKEQTIVESVISQTNAQCVNLAGKTTLRESIALIDRCKAFLTNDSGAMHLAAALRIPVVAIFGSTNPATTAPFGEGHILIRHPQPCSPCLERVCPTDFRCMLDIRPDEVVQACERQLESEV